PVDLLAAAPGYEAFETAFAAALTALGDEKLPRLIELLTVGPAEVLRQPAPTLAPGEPADVLVLAADESWTCEAATLAAPVARTPLAGRRLTGRVRQTILDGRIVFDGGSFPLDRGPGGVAG
ncbi:MAG: dihydroorotase, partial [Planctomycetota bacterium]